MKDVEWHHSEFQQHSVTRRITLRYCGVLHILHAVPQISSSVLRHNTALHQALSARSRASLWLLGSKGCGTRFHVDWAEANNIAWAIGEEKVVTFQACPPVAMYTLHDFQQNMDSTVGFARHC